MGSPFNPLSMLTNRVSSKTPFDSGLGPIILVIIVSNQVQCLSYLLSTIAIMAVLDSVPGQYIGRWNANVQPSTRNGSSVTASEMSSIAQSHIERPKLNTSCNGCRASRVKCSGGKPCKRCAASSSSLLCTYSISRRRGKRKAVNSPSSDSIASTLAQAPEEVRDTNAGQSQPMYGDNWITGQDTPLADQDIFGNIVSSVMLTSRNLL